MSEGAKIDGGDDLDERQNLFPVQKESGPVNGRKFSFVTFFISNMSIPVQLSVIERDDDLQSSFSTHQSRHFLSARRLIGSINSVQLFEQSFCLPS